MKTLLSAFLAVAAAAAPAPAQTHRFGFVELATGVRLRYAEQGDPAGEAVIMMHGTSDSWFSFSRVLPLLSPRYRVYALDLRGHGESSQPAAGYGMDDLAADVVAFMDAKRIARANLVGHSMGSYIARRVVHAAPDRVSRLVLVGSGTGFGHLPDLQGLREAVMAFTDSVPLEFIREFQYSTVHQPLPAAFMDQVIRESRRLPVRVWHGLFEGMWALPSGVALGMPTGPVLLMQGDRDAVFPPDEFARLVAQLPAAEVRVFAETGHAPHWERPGQFARDLEAFLGRPARQASR